MEKARLVYLQANAPSIFLNRQVPVNSRDLSVKGEEKMRFDEIDLQE